MLRTLHVPLRRWVIFQQLATWSRRQWKVAGWSYLAALLIMGVTGETLVERIFREVRAFRIYDGPSEVHRWSLAQRIARQGANW